MTVEAINLGTSPTGGDGDTARQAFEKVNNNFAGLEGIQLAFSAANFEANRARNKEMYAASGIVRFGNHESGKQVNPCKPGLYTSLTTPNKLLMGKSGGVGGSKTDYAVVHIDGIVFELTNGFAIDLPSHPNSTLPDREDIYGLEVEKVEVTQASPTVYQAGLRANPATNFYLLSAALQKAFLAANSNTTYFDENGKLWQWQLYATSFAGLSGEASLSDYGYTKISFGDLWTNGAKTLLQLGTANRLNDGGYHPGFNPNGAAKFLGDTYWYNTAESITSRADCFDQNKLLANSGSIASGKSGHPDGRFYDAIYADGQGGVCRDMRYSANGLTPVDFDEADLRVKNGTYRGFEKRAFTKVAETGPILSSGSWDGGTKRVVYASGNPFNISASSVYPIGSAYVVDIATKEVREVAFINYSSGADRTGYYLEGSLGDTWTGASFCIFPFELAGSVGGSFLQTDVIADPANIPQIEALKDGWDGRWIPVIPNGTSLSFPFTRKLIATGNHHFTSDNGATWGTATGHGPDFSLITNARLYSCPANQVAIHSYQAFAKQTESANNGVVYGGKGRLCGVFSSARALVELGNLLCESTLGVILVSDYVSGKPSYANQILKKFSIDTVVTVGALEKSAAYAPEHEALVLDAAPNSKAFKVLDYNVNINQQAFKQYAATELKHDGTDWGDDGKVTIVDGESTKIDLNGNTVKVTTHKLKEPIGWIKNGV